MWIGPFDYENHKVGDRAFLVRQSHNLRGSESYDLRDTPPQTNQSFEYRFKGWCGTYNDLATYGEGAVEIVKVAANGRLKIKQLEGEKLTAMLDDFGFPEIDTE